MSQVRILPGASLIIRGGAEAALFAFTYIVKSTAKRCRARARSQLKKFSSRTRTVQFDKGVAGVWNLLALAPGDRRLNGGRRAGKFR